MCCQASATRLFVVADAANIFYVCYQPSPVVLQRAVGTTTRSRHWTFGGFFFPPTVICFRTTRLVNLYHSNQVFATSVLEFG
jgi:hypothetical protein